MSTRSASPNDSFSEDLLAWYRANRRALPWRTRQHDAYAIWISEIMLQQTTVAAVAPFYERWMARFPTVRALAEASLDEVLRHWAGLGYYARARNIKKAAELVSGSFGGLLPDNVDELMRLPGIGRYTAGAIASIAYDVRAPILDANVTRVLARLYAVHGDPKSAPAQARLWQIAQDLLPDKNPGDFNQALMELGALICLPSSPRCPLCPVGGYCAANAEGDPTAYPELAKSKRWLDVRHAAALLEEDGRILLIRRPEEGLWGGLWELPRATAADGEASEECAVRAAKDSVGLEVCAQYPFGQVKHVVMNRRITLNGFRVRRIDNAQPAALACAAFAWVAPDDLASYALSSPQQNLLAQWEKRRGQGFLEI
jgi:A/G-specific adenine glycosylase